MFVEAMQGKSLARLPFARLKMRSGNPENLVIPSQALVPSAPGRFWLSECTVSIRFCGKKNSDSQPWILLA